MTRPSRPDVSDPDLRAALDRVGPHIENYQQNLDLISKDIKAIEHYLTTSGVRLREGVKIGYTEKFVDGDYDVMGNYSGGITRDVERIEWAPADDRGDRWRLMYTVYRRYGQVEICERIAMFGPTFKDETDELERKPLIETSVEVRLRAHKILAKLVSQVAALVEVQPIVEPITDDDIPF